MSTEFPLVTFLLISYNQENYIKAAIEGALSQMYSPLEIIISDDASSDSTWHIINRVASSYHGPHNIRLNRNSCNLGIGNHLTDVMKMVRGEFIILAAGDDISLPERTNYIVKLWLQSNRTLTSIYSSYSRIDSSGAMMDIGGKLIGNTGNNKESVIKVNPMDLVTHWKGLVNGATHACSPSLSTIYGGLTSDQEDLVLSYRSLLSGSICYIDVPLVLYRIHNNNTCDISCDNTYSINALRNYDSKRLRTLSRLVSAYNNILSDTKTAYSKSIINEKQRDALICASIKSKQRFKYEHLIIGSPLYLKFWYWALLLFCGYHEGGLRCFMYLLPYRLRLFCKYIKHVVH